MAETVIPEAPPPSQKEPAAQQTVETKPAPLASPFADLDDLFKEEPVSEETKPETKKPVEQKTQKPQAQKPVEKDKQDKKLEESKKGLEPEGLKSVRSAYEQASKRIKELEAEIEKSKSPTEDPEKKQLAERIEAIEKRRQELEEELNYAAYERGTDYKERYGDPLAHALESGTKFISNFKVTDSEGNQQQATPEMFMALCRMGTDEAIRQAKIWFPEDAAIILQRVDRVVQLKEAAESAINDYRKRGVEREKTRMEENAKKNRELAQLWKQFVDNDIKQRPKLFKADDDDLEGKKRLDDGFKLADAAFRNNEKMTREQKAELDAAIHNRAAGYSYAVYRWQKAERRAKELEKKLSEYESSEPGEGSGKRVPKQQPATWMDEIDALAMAGS